MAKNPRSGSQKRKEKMNEREKYWTKIVKDQEKKEKAKKAKAKKEKEKEEKRKEEEIKEEEAEE